MYTIRPEITFSEGVSFFLQSVETTDNFVLLRLREAEQGSLINADPTNRKVETERFTLRNGNNEAVPMSHLVSTGEGPFSGIVDVAFPKSDSLDLEDTFALTSKSCRLHFRI